MDGILSFCLSYWVRLSREVLKHTLHFIIVMLTGYRPGSIDRWIYYPLIHVVASVVLFGGLAACIFILGMVTCGLIELGKFVLLEAATMSIPESCQDIFMDIQGGEDIYTLQLDVWVDMEGKVRVQRQELEPGTDDGELWHEDAKESQQVVLLEYGTVCDSPLAWGTTPSPYFEDVKFVPDSSLIPYRTTNSCEKDMFADCYFDDLISVYTSSPSGKTTPDRVMSTSSSLPPYSEPQTPMSRLPIRSVTFLLNDKARNKSQCDHAFWRCPSPSHYYTASQRRQILRQLSDPKQYRMAEAEGPANKVDKVRSVWYRFGESLRRPLDRIGNREKGTGSARFTYAISPPPLTLVIKKQTTGTLASY